MQPKPKLSKKRGCVYAFVALFACGIIGALMPDSPATPKGQALSEVEAFTEMPVSTRTPRPTLTATATLTAAEEATLEAIFAEFDATPAPDTHLGLRANGLTDFLKERGFTCSGVVESLDGVLSWSCDKTDAGTAFHIELYSRTFDLEFIEAIETGGIHFLSLIAAQVNSDSARWVEENAGAADVSKNFDGVLFHLWGDSQARTLEIGVMP